MGFGGVGCGGWEIPQNFLGHSSGVLPLPIPSPAPKGPHLHLKPEVTKSVPHCKDTPELCSPSAESSSPHIFPRLSSQAEQIILGWFKIPAHR